MTKEVLEDMFAAFAYLVTVLLGITLYLAARALVLALQIALVFGVLMLCYKASVILGVL